jgi:glucosylceramidase
MDPITTHRPPRERLIKVLAVVATAAVGASALFLLQGTAQAATGPTVSVWTTTPDRSQLMAKGTNQVFDSAGSRPGQMINVDPQQQFQTMDGFGASLTDSSAALLYGLPAAQRDEVMRSIFDPVNGIGMSVLRQPIGSSDFVDEPHYTYDDLPAGQTDLTMARFSIAHDEAQILPLLRQALQLNPSLKIMASPWGQPAWMKANNSIVGGRLKDDPAIFRAYALYLVKFVQAYQAAGVPVYALTVQNEPQNRTPLAYPGTDMPVAHHAAIVNELGPMLRDSGLGNVKIISYDHNWAQHPDDAADAIALGVPAEPNYAADLLRTSAAQWIDGTGYHCYAGDVSAQTAMHNAYPSKNIYFTECSGWHGVNDSKTQAFSDTLKWHARNIALGTTQNWSKTVINWNLALNSRGGPGNGGCIADTTGYCTGALQIDGSAVVRNAEYYTLGHMSKFVKTGAVRIGSTNAGDVHSVAFRNPDNSIAVVVNNIGGGTQTYGVSYNGMVVTETVPPGAIQTLTWPSTGAGSPSATPPTPSASATPTPTTPGGAPVDPAKWYQVISANSGKCLDVAGSGTANGAVLQQWACSSPATHQLWQFRVTSAGYFQVVPRHAPGLAWDVSGGTSATGDGRQVNMWTFGGGTNQQWQPQAVSGGYKLVARHSGKCLDVRDVSMNDGAWLQQWSCTGGPAQTFRLVAQP